MYEGNPLSFEKDDEKVHQLLHSPVKPQIKLKTSESSFLFNWKTTTKRRPPPTLSSLLKAATRFDDSRPQFSATQYTFFTLFFHVLF
jgi:hypothetical protein